MTTRRSEWSDQELARQADEVEASYDPMLAERGTVLTAQSDGRMTLPRKIFKHRRYLVETNSDGSYLLTPVAGTEFVP